MKTSTVFITGAVLPVGLLGCAEVASASDHLVGNPTAFSTPAVPLQYIPSETAPIAPSDSTEPGTELTPEAPAAATAAPKATAKSATTQTTAKTTTVKAAAPRTTATATEMNPPAPVNSDQEPSTSAS